MRETWRIGDYAVSSRQVGTTTTDAGPDGSFSRLKFAFDIEASDGTRCRVDGRQRRREAPVPDEEPGLWDLVLEETLGVSNVAPPAPWSESIEAIVTVGDAPGEAWELAATRHWMPGTTVDFDGTLTRGARTLVVRSRSLESSATVAIEIYEDGEWLGAHQKGEYSFRAGHDPQFRMLLLGALEVLSLP